jgi:HSP20 family protein
MVRNPQAEFWIEPLAALKRIQDEINRTFVETRTAAATDYPPVNIWRGEVGLILTAEVPGVRLEDLDLTVHQNTLTIRGRREPDAAEPAASFHRRERAFGPFARTVTLPYGIDAERIRAVVDNGILTVEMPRPESERPRKIVVTKA